MIPLKDNVPTSGFPLVTIVLIVVNIGFFVWQLSFSDRPTTRARLPLGLSERDQNTLQYGAIPYRLLHPGEECAVGAVKVSSGPGRAGSRLPRDRRIPAGARLQGECAAAVRAARRVSWFATTSPRCSCTAASSTSSSTCSSCGSSATTSRTRWAGCHSCSSTCSAGWSPSTGQAAAGPELDRADDRSQRRRRRGPRRLPGSAAARSRGPTLIFLIFFVTVIEMPA